MNSMKTELGYKSFDDLVKMSKYDFTKINFNNRSTCTSLLKIYDQGLSYLNLGNEENAYLLLMRFFEAIQLLRKSELYKKDKPYVDSLINSNKLTKTLESLEKVKKSLIQRYKSKIDEQEKLTLKAEEEERIRINLSESKKLPKLSELSIEDKKFMTPTELKNSISTTDYKFLIIDTRSKSEFDYSHLNLNILLTEDKKTQNLIHYMNLPNEIIENVPWKLEESLRKFDADNMASSMGSKLFAARNEYDFIVLLDRDSTSANLTKSNSKLLMLKKAIYEFDQNLMLKNEPIILNGGWNQWITYFPCFSSSTNSNNEQSSLVDPDKQEKNHLKQILDFDYPVIAKLAQPIVPKPATNDVKKSVELEKIEPTPVQSDQNNEINKKGSNILSIPIVNRLNKPLQQQPIQNNQNNKLENNIKQPDSMPKFTPPQIQPQPTTHKPANQQPTLPNFQPPTLPSNLKNSDVDSTNIFESVYRPNNRLNSFQSPLMKDGSKKVLDPVTGVFKIYSNAPSQLNRVNVPVAPISKSAGNDKENIKPTINYENKPKFESKPLVDKSLQFKPPKSNLKRTLSIPNIASLNDEDTFNPFNKELETDEDENKPFNLIPNPKQNPERIRTVPKLDPASKPNKISNQITRPNVNRKAKPQVEDPSIHLRIQELDPVYADATPGLCGIKNFGNTCFMNCIIQCLNSSSYFVDFFLNNHYKKDLNRTNELGFRGEVADEYAVIVSALWSGHCKAIAPKRFKAIIGQFNEQFLSNEQQDSQEFLLFLMDGLHEDLNRIKKRPRITNDDNENDNLSDIEAANKAWDIHLSINNSIIVDLFQGQFKSSITCQTCKKQSVKFEPFMYLTLPILPSKCTIYQCLQMFLKAENMVGECKWKCPRCKDYRDAVKKIDIWKLPPYLIIHLKRFKYQGVWRDKISTYVDFPIDNLQLESFIPNNVNREPFNYRLYGVSNHMGTLDGGHYTAFCKHLETDRWYKFDDTNVKEVHDKAALKSTASYILFYSLV